jgi:hypothetical protein
MKYGFMIIRVIKLLKVLINGINYIVSTQNNIIYSFGGNKM